MRVRYALTFGRGERRHRMRERTLELGLEILAERTSLLCLASGDTPHLLNEDGILLGRLFLRNRSEPVTRLGPGTADGACVSPDPHWGNFAWFMSADGRARVYRDPSGGVPVYRCGGTSDAIFVSDAELVAAMGLLEEATVSEHFVIHWLQYPFLRTAGTGFEGIVEVLPGAALDLVGNHWVEGIGWRPHPFCKRSAAILDPAKAARELRCTALATVPSQLAEERTLLRLSGGLDSSIIAACLAQAGRKVACINFATRAPEGDERDYARAVAGSFGFPLSELHEAGEATLESPAQLSFRPATNPLLLPFETIVSAASAGQFELIVDGAGGDNLFCHLTSAAPVFDALRWRGPAQAVQTIADIAVRANASWWDVVRAARRHIVPRRTWPEDRSFLKPEVLLARPDPHPWLDALGGVPAGKRQHVEALVHIHHFLDRTPSSVPRAHPLLAQPLLELCLRIPAWMWMQGGRDRAVARDAFDGLLPASVLRRRGKGSLQSLFYRSFSALRTEIMDLLMAGRLASMGLLDAHAVERVLRTDGWMREGLQLRLSEVAALELWLRSSTLRGAHPSGDTAPAYRDQDRARPAASTETSRGSGHRPRAGGAAAP